MKIPNNYSPISKAYGSSLLTSASAYRKHWLTIKADSIAWAIFAPDWDSLRRKPTAELLNLIAQSVGINPDFANYDWLKNHALSYFDSKGDDEGFEKILKFMERVADSLEYLFPRGQLKPVPRVTRDGLLRFYRSDFIEAASAAGWSLPGEFIQPLALDDVVTMPLQTERTLIPKQRNTTELLELIYNMLDALNINTGDGISQLSAKKAWGKIISGHYVSDLIKTIEGERRTTSFILNDGTVVDFKDFSTTYNRRFVKK